MTLILLACSDEAPPISEAATGESGPAGDVEAIADPPEAEDIDPATGRRPIRRGYGIG